MGEHRRPRSKTSVLNRATARRAFDGTLCGLAIAALALLVAGARLVLVLMGGGTLSESSGFLRQVGWYVLGFALAGTIVGALWPLTRSLLGRYALGVLGAFIVAAAIATASAGPVGSWHRGDWYAVVGVGLFFGLVAGRTFKAV